MVLFLLSPQVYTSIYILVLYKIIDPEKIQKMVSNEMYSCLFENGINVNRSNEFS